VWNGSSSTEQDLPATLVQNLVFLHGFHAADSTGLLQGHREFLLENLWGHILQDRNRPLAQICTDLDLEVGVGPGSHLLLTKHALSNRRWPVDMLRKIGGDVPLPLLPPKVEKHG
jgi:hypothetical protein